MDVKMLSIDEAGLSNRCQNALRRAGIHTVGELFDCTEESLNEIRNLGRKSIDEILSKIEEYKAIDAAGGLPDPVRKPEGTGLPEDFDAWLKEDAGKNYVISWLKAKGLNIDALELLSPRAYNLLMLNGYTHLHQVAFLGKADLMQIPRMDSGSADEIVRLCNHYLKDSKSDILTDYAAVSAVPPLFDLLHMPEYRDAILKYVKANDRDIRQLGLSNRPVNCLLNQGCQKLSDIIFLTRAELQALPAMGTGSVEEVMVKINDYLSANEARLLAVCTGDETALLDDAAIRERILQQYQEIGFGGLSLREMTDRLQLPESITEDRLKKVIGGLLAENELEYVDFRCYRVYGRFSDFLECCDSISERSRELIRRRLEGGTLESIAQEYGLTRERVRQIIRRDVRKIQDWYRMNTGKVWFDEDYFRYFYETYSFEKKDAAEWFGMTPAICSYLDMMDVKRGSKELQAALEDQQGLDAGLRLKVKNYLNRNKLYVDGRWVEKRRADLEEVVARKFCREAVSFEEFIQLYNEFLEREEVAYDEELYYTDSVLRTRKSRLADARFLLWKQNEQLRYYDMEGRDFTELLDTLNLAAYENIEFSTLKFVEEYPEILEKYDIRDQYELHNLLRKIVPEGSYHDFHCGRMPEIKFGAFDRDAAILDILIDHAPISTADLCDLIHAEYGYEPAVIMATYLRPFAEYYHQGIYRIDQKAMTAEHKDALKTALTEDFYYIDEVRKIYRGLFPDADPEEVNPYNLKGMGFVVLSRYMIQNHPSLEAFCEDILTRDDILDLTPYRKRLVYVQMFSQKLMELKRSLQVIEFEPNQIIQFRKLEQSGVTREMIRDFCDAVYDFTDDGSYFSIQSLRQDGFASDLDQLGFSDWFYANLLISDERFSYGTMFGNIILYKGHESITIKSFETDRIRAHGSIDIYDLMTELTDRFGCRISDRFDLIYKVQGTEIYYDKFLDRLYANADTYYRELDAAEGL